MERVEREKAMFAFEWHYIVRLDRCLSYLKPDDLTIRRVWNKKYPVKLCMPRQNGFRKKRINSTLEELTLDMDSILEETATNLDSTFSFENEASFDCEDSVGSGNGFDIKKVGFFDFFLIF